MEKEAYLLIIQVLRLVRNIIRSAEYFLNDLDKCTFELNFYFQAKALNWSSRYAYMIIVDEEHLVKLLHINIDVVIAACATPESEGIFPLWKVCLISWVPGWKKAFLKREAENNHGEF